MTIITYCMRKGLLLLIILAVILTFSSCVDNSINIIDMNSDYSIEKNLVGTWTFSDNTEKWKFVFDKNMDSVWEYPGSTYKGKYRVENRQAICMLDSNGQNPIIYINELTQKTLSITYRTSAHGYYRTILLRN